MPVEVSAELTIPDDELEWTYTTSGGPGGQHANRNQTRVRLAWDVASSSAVSGSTKVRLQDTLGSTVRVDVDDTRSQFRNRAIAAQRLADKVSTALKQTRRRKATRPSKGSKHRRLDAKRRRSDTKRLRRRPHSED